MSRLIAGGATCGAIAAIAESRYGFTCHLVGAPAAQTGAACRVIVNRGCEAPPPADLILLGDGYTPHEGQTVYANVVRADGVVVASGDDVVVDYQVEIALEAAVEAGETYHIDFFADYNDNGTCDGLYDDHIWQTDDFEVSYDARVEVMIDHTGDFTDAGCDSF
jgi:hypothetical protein